MAANERVVEQPGWAEGLYRPHRYKILYGGRGSGKSWAIAAALILQGQLRPIRVACVREHQAAIHESAKKTLENWIERLDLLGEYRVTQNHITHINGSHFFFRGMSTSTEEEIRGWEDVDIVWVEEAHMMSKRARDILYPTIRKPGSEIWMSFNPKNRYDPAYQDFVVRQREGAWVRKINYQNNSHFPDELDRERRATEVDEPERYAHIWLGEPDDTSDKRKVLPYAMTRACVDAWDDRPAPDGVIHAGLDIADTGQDKNALVARRGPALFHAEQWSSSILGDTVRRANAWAVENGVQRLNYDVGGPGGSMRSYLTDMGPREYSARPIIFGGKVGGPDVVYTRGATNEQFFARRNAQMGWGLRIRANATQRLVRGDDIDPARCLFINPEIKNLEAFLAQLSQPEWGESVSSHLVIEKAPDDAPSPDLYDAAILAFAHDSSTGLRRPR